MKYLLPSILLLIPGMLYSQDLMPASISVSYFGESITHPGLRISANYELGSWEKYLTKRSRKERNIRSSFNLSPGVGFFYHKDYQTGFFVLPEVSYMRKKTNGNFVAYGLGAGYMRTVIPDVYYLNSDGEIVETTEGHNYFLTNYFVALGKDLDAMFQIPMQVYIKPQIMYALPGTPTGVWYFAAEIGVHLKL